MIDKVLTLDYEYLFRISSAALTPLIAIVAIYIAYQQFRTNQMKLRHDLYEKRMSIYRKVYEYLNSIIAYGNVTDEKTIEFYSQTSESHFLFNDYISDYIKLIFLNSKELRRVNKFIDGEYECSEDERKKATERDEQLMLWFNDQFDIAKEKFAKVIRIRY